MMNVLSIDRLYPVSPAGIKLETVLVLMDVQKPEPEDEGKADINRQRDCAITHLRLVWSAPDDHEVEQQNGDHYAQRDEPFERRNVHLRPPDARRKKASSTVVLAPARGTGLPIAVDVLATPRYWNTPLCRPVCQTVIAAPGKMFFSLSIFITVQETTASDRQLPSL